MSRLKLISSLLVFAVLLCVWGTPLLGAEKISDLSPSHWAYQAVKKLVDAGYLQLYDDGTFRGNYPVDRYTLASVVAKVLVEMGEGSTETSKEDIELIRKLSNEFRSELVMLTMKNKALEERLAKIEESKLILAEDQTKNSTNIKLLSNEAKELQNQVASLARDILAEKKRLDRLEQDLEVHKISNTRSEQAQKAELVKLQNELNMVHQKLEEERNTNRTYMIILGVLSLLGLLL